MEVVRCEKLPGMEKAEEFQANKKKKKKFNLMLHGIDGPLHSVSCSCSNYCDNDAKNIRQHHQPLMPDLINRDFNVVGSCDGLLLVVVTTGVGVGGSQVIYIWNPTTGEHKTLPQLSSSMKNNIVFGFGPDLTTDNNNHYKVLLLETEYGESIAEFKVNLYTTHTNSWKTLLPNAPFCYTTPHPKGMVLAYNNLHYLAEIDITEDDPPAYDSIISFDLKDDKFRVLPMVPGTLLLNLCALNAHLCAFSVVTGDDTNFNLYGLWRMENFGDHNLERWIKMYSIDCCVGFDNPITFISPLHFLEDGQILFYAEPKPPRRGKPFIVSYNTDNKKARFLVQVNVPFWSIPVVYEESFISPNTASTAQEELPGQLKHRRTYMERCTRDSLSPTTL